ncbi:MAG: dihydroorotate dehydrogenase electron transfer subunit [Pseudomonadota bacterium]|nr:dihydroorotate dehydrogenase electron transfer subunit [Pseudomonadota bacterium]
MARKKNSRNSISQTSGEIIQVARHDGDQVSIRIHCPLIAKKAQPGHFVHVKCSESLEMRRPMSIMRAAEKNGWIEILFRVTGIGTKALSEQQKGDHLDILGPIGQPFRLKGYLKHLILIGGGVGIPPLLFLAEHLKKSNENITVIVLMGSETPFPFKISPSKIYVNSMPAEAIAGIPLLESMGTASRLATKQGFQGCYDGHVTELAKEYLNNLSIAKENVEIFACGPTPMLIEAQQLAEKYCERSQVSVEEYMACAIGGCAGCTVRVQTEAGLAMKRVCVDGPVFDGAEVILS